MRDFLGNFRFSKRRRIEAPPAQPTDSGVTAPHQRSKAAVAPACAARSRPKTSGAALQTSAETVVKATAAAASNLPSHGAVRSGETASSSAAPNMHKAGVDDQSKLAAGVGGSRAAVASCHASQKHAEDGKSHAIELLKQASPPKALAAARSPSKHAEMGPSNSVTLQQQQITAASLHTSQQDQQHSASLPSGTSPPSTALPLKQGLPAEKPCASQIQAIDVEVGQPNGPTGQDLAAASFDDLTQLPESAAAELQALVLLPPAPPPPAAVEAAQCAALHASAEQSAQSAERSSAVPAPQLATQPLSGVAASQERMRSRVPSSSPGPQLGIPGAKSEAPIPDSLLPCMDSQLPQVWGAGYASTGDQRLQPPHAPHSSPNKLDWQPCIHRPLLHATGLSLGGTPPQVVSPDTFADPEALLPGAAPSSSGFSYNQTQPIAVAGSDPHASSPAVAPAAAPEPCSAPVIDAVQAISLRSGSGAKCSLPLSDVTPDNVHALQPSLPGDAAEQVGQGGSNPEGTSGSYDLAAVIPDTYLDVAPPLPPIDSAVSGDSAAGCAVGPSAAAAAAEHTSALKPPSPQPAIASGVKPAAAAAEHASPHDGIPDKGAAATAATTTDAGNSAAVAAVLPPLPPPSATTSSPPLAAAAVVGAAAEARLPSAATVVETSVPAIAASSNAGPMYVPPNYFQYPTGSASVDHNQAAALPVVNGKADLIAGGKYADRFSECTWC